MDKIIIVGSSSNVLKKELGDKIDSFDKVIRFNRAPIEGYEKYVGKKTTDRFVNMHVIVNKPKNDEDLSFISTLRNQNIVSDTKITNDTFYEHYHTSCTYYYFSRHVEFKKFKQQITKIDKYKEFENFKGVEPSIGLGTILHYLNAGKKVYIYGFHIDSTNYKESPHYWKIKKHIGGAHDFKYERELLKKLIEDEYIHYLK